MSHHCSINNPVLNTVPQNVDGYGIVDCGFGYGYWGYSIKVRKAGDPTLVGLEIFPQYIEKVRKTKIYDHLILGDIRRYPFRKESADLVIATEVLEHIEREQGLKLIDELFKLCRKRTIISTPMGFMRTKGYDDNEHQIHKSAYYYEDFRRRGYHVRIIRMQPLPRLIRIFEYIYRRLRGWYAVRKQIVACKVRGT